MGLRVRATIVGNYGTCGLSVSELRCEVKCNNHSCLLLYPKTRYFVYLVQRLAQRFVLSVDVALDILAHVSVSPNYIFKHFNFIGPASFFFYFSFV